MQSVEGNSSVVCIFRIAFEMETSYNHASSSSSSSSDMYMYAFVCVFLTICGARRYVEEDVLLVEGQDLLSSPLCLGNSL